MASESTTYLPTQIGHLTLKMKGDNLLSLSIGDKDSIVARRVNSNIADMSNLPDKILLQLNNYFSTATLFENISLAAEGTAFQKSVWHELINIPIGETRTYGEIANTLHSSARAVGNACRKNPIQIIVPCHRVISVQGLGGYAGETKGRQLNIKRWLLNHEGVSL